MNITNKKIFSNKALLPDGWANNILLEIDRAGLISSITKNCDKDKVSFDLNKKSQANLLEKRNIKEVKVGAIKRSIRRGDVITPTDVIEISIPENKATDIFPNFKDK